MKTLKSQFLVDLAEIFDAEYRIARALPKMNKSDISAELKEAILSHARETEWQVRKVEQLFECFGLSATRKPQCATAGHATQGDEIADGCGSSLADEGALLSALKVVEQGDRPINGSSREWEIAAYRCLKQWINEHGNSQGAEFLEQILAEEEMAGQSEPEHSRFMGKQAI